MEKLNVAEQQPHVPLVTIVIVLSVHHFDTTDFLLFA